MFYVQGFISYHYFTNIDIKFNTQCKVLIFLKQIKAEKNSVQGFTSYHYFTNIDIKFNTLCKVLIFLQ